MRDAYLADTRIPDNCRLFIGEGVTIKGETSVPDTLVVCGVLEGDVSAGNLVVCETGVIRGKIVVAENAEVFGKVFEKFDVKRLLILRSTGSIDGNVSYGTLQIEQGASIAGGIASNNLRHEQKPAKGDLSQKNEQRPLAVSYTHLDVYKRQVDVVVTEGFAGNIAIKTAEGTARQFAEYLRSAMSRSLGARIGYLFARSAFRQVRERMDPRRVNGGVFLGLNGIVIKSHGGSDAEGFAAAIELGYGVVRDELLAKITAALGRPGREPQPVLRGAAS